MSFALDAAARSGGADDVEVGKKGKGFGETILVGSIGQPSTLAADCIFALRLKHSVGQSAPVGSFP